MPETTPFAIEQIKSIDALVFPRAISYEESYQGPDMGDKTPQEAGVNYQYFYFTYDIRPPSNPLVAAQIPDITINSHIVMDPDQMAENDWRDINVNIYQYDNGQQRVIIKAFTENERIEATIRHFCGSETSTNLHIVDIQRKHYRLTQNGAQTIVLNREEKPDSEIDFALGIYTSMMEFTQWMLGRGFSQGNEA